MAEITLLNPDYTPIKTEELKDLRVGIEDFEGKGYRLINIDQDTAKMIKKVE